MAPVVEILPHGKYFLPTKIILVYIEHRFISWKWKRMLCTVNISNEHHKWKYLTLSILWLLMIWWCKNTEHQQPRYWPSVPRIIHIPHKEGWFWVANSMHWKFSTLILWSMEVTETYHVIFSEGACRNFKPIAFQRINLFDFFFRNTAAENELIDRSGFPIPGIPEAVLPITLTLCIWGSLLCITAIFAHQLTVNPSCHILGSENLDKEKERA